MFIFPEAIDAENAKPLFSQYLGWKSRNHSDTWGTVSFEDWNRHLRYANNQAGMSWTDFVKLRDEGMEEGK